MSTAESFTKSEIEKSYAAHESRFIERWKAALRFPSMSANPVHNGDCRNCAQFFVQLLSSLGFVTELIETESKPLVFATRAGDPTLPTVLYYGHYDVQPPEPLELWHSQPFEPEIRGGRLYARGANDDKGQMISFLCGVEMAIERGTLKNPLKILIEGEEESGSEALSENLEKLKDRFKADYLLVCDTDAHETGQPAITVSLRGVVHLEFALKALNHDLHSGLYGGLVKNVALELAKLLATLHNPDGSVAVAGFYDGVREDPAEQKLALSVHFDHELFKKQIGCEANGGETRFPPQIRNGLRPTLEVNGVYSGYSGPGTKTVIPARGGAKLSARVVGGQDPDGVLNAIEKHLRAHTPQGIEITVTGRGGGGALAVNLKSPLIEKAKRAITTGLGQEPGFMWCGASVPIVAKLGEACGAEPLLVGFGMSEDKIHSPNESFSLEQFKNGALYGASIMTELGKR